MPTWEHRHVYTSKALASYLRLPSWQVAEHRSISEPQPSAADSHDLATLVWTVEILRLWIFYHCLPSCVEGVRPVERESNASVSLFSSMYLGIGAKWLCHLQTPDRLR